LQGAKVPRSRVGESGVEAGPRAFSPAVLVGKIAAGYQGVQGLDDEGTACVQQRRRGAEYSFDRFFTKQREVTDADINGDLQFAGSNLLVGSHTKLATSGLAGP